MNDDRPLPKQSGYDPQLHGNFQDALTYYEQAYQILEKLIESEARGWRFCFCVLHDGRTLET